MTVVLSLFLALVLPAAAALVALSDSGTEPLRSPSDVDEVDVGPHAGVDLDLARGLSCGLATWLLGSGFLVRTVGLSATSAWAWDVSVGVASVAVLVAVLVMRRRRGRPGPVLWPALRRFGVCAGLSALVFSPVAFVVLRTSWSPLGSTPWYYYGLARQVAANGSIPATSVEFGTRTPFLNDYHLFTTGTAMLLVQQPGHPMLVITSVTLLAVLLLGFGVVALSSALGAGRTTSLCAIPVALAAGIGAMRLDAYRPEGFALGLVVLATALSVDWFRRGRRASLVVAGVLVATLSQVHGIAAVTAGVMVLAAGLAFVVRGPRGPNLRRWVSAIVTCAGAVVVAGLVFQEASGTTHASGLVDQGGLADPTWEFYRAGMGFAASVPPSNAAMLYDVPGYLFGRSWWWIVVGVVLAAVGLWARRRDPASRLLVVFTLSTIVGIGLVGSVFMLGWHGYVPRRTGASRFPLEASLLVPSFVAVGLGCLARMSWRWRGHTVPDRRRRPTMLVVLVVCALASSLDVARYVSSQALSSDDLAVWSSLPLKPGDVVLANGYTEGFIPDVTPADGLLDGRAPYTFGDLLHRANSLFRGAHAFFADPSAHWDFLRRNDVSWVVVGDPSGYALSTGNTWSVPRGLGALEQCPGLRLVVDDSPRIAAFRVVDPGRTGCTRSRRAGSARSRSG